LPNEAQEKVKEVKKFENKAQKYGQDNRLSMKHFLGIFRGFESAAGVS